MNINLNRVSVKPLTMRRRIAPILGLLFLSPFIAEFLLGNISISAIAVLPFLALMYGCGSILIREITRRKGYGWPTMIVMGFAYGILEEGLITQSLFNPSYANADLLIKAPIPELGISAWWTLFVLTLHKVWSTSVPIALIALAGEALLTYAWHSFIESPVIRTVGTVDRIGNGVFSLAVIIILFLSYKSLMRTK